MAPLDQQALMRWMESQLEKAKATWDRAYAAGEVHVFGVVLARMKRGNLPELDDVDAVIKEFVQIREQLEALTGSHFAEGQRNAEVLIEKKIRELMGIA
ncbi:MAG: hypothetical protein ACYCU0_01240 [Solirubrobacteraceae bacterium]